METQQSENIGKLAEALAKAQSEITGARKTANNPFFKSKYADLAEVWDACREALAKNDLAVIQATQGHAERPVIVTTLAHKSGEWMRGYLEMNPTKPDPQGVGSAITYGRRYALAAMVGVAQVDDDANAASVEKPFTYPDGTTQKDVDSKAVKAAYTEIVQGIEEDDEHRVFQAYDELKDAEKASVFRDLKTTHKTKVKEIMFKLNQKESA